MSKRRSRAEYHKNRHLLKKYGLGLEEYERLSESCHGRCRICKKRSGAPLIVSRHPATGDVRGLLCRRCFALVSFSEEDSALLGEVCAFIHNPPFTISHSFDNLDG